MNRLLCQFLLGSFIVLGSPVFASYSPVMPPATKDASLLTLFNIIPSDALETPSLQSPLLGSGGQVTITGTETISFLEALFYSDTSCSTLLGKASAIDNTTGFGFTSGETVSVNSDSTYQLANDKGITTGDIQCMRLYVNGGNQSPGGISCQDFTDETCSGTSCSSSQIKTATWSTGSSSAVCPTRHAYVGNNLNSTVSVCDVNNSTGALSNCSAQNVTLSSDQLTGITMINGYAYLSYVKSSPDEDGIVTCTVDASSGALSDCAQSGSIAALVTPFLPVVDTKFLYVSNSTATITYSIAQCTITSSTGAISCADSGSGVFSSAKGAAFNNGHIYVSSQNSNSIYRCDVDATTGALSSCATAATNIPSPVGLAIYNDYLYIGSSPSTARVYFCHIENDGSLTGCNFLNPPEANTLGRPLSLAVSNGYLYITNFTRNQDVIKCSISLVDGTLSSCASQSGVFFNRPNAIVIQ